MPSAGFPSLNMEGLATINFEIVNENTNTNNIQLYDMANRENGFWSQAEEELFYTPQPLFSLVSQLPFSNTVYIDGDHYLPADADLLFGELDSDDDESLEQVETGTDETPVVTETVDETLSGIERVNDTPFVTEAVDVTPITIESVDETSVHIETEDDTQFVAETVDETEMFADQISSSRTASFEPDITEEPVVIETADVSAVSITTGSSVTFASQRCLSRTSSFGPDTTMEYPHNADLIPDILWDSAERSPIRVSSVQSLMMQASDIDDAVLEATRDALRAACEVDSSTVEGASFLDSVLQVTRDILMTTYETERDGTRSIMEESLNYIRGYEILRDVVTEIVNESDTMPADLKQFIARFSELRRLPFCYSSSDQSLFQPARLESDVEPQGTSDIIIREEDETDTSDPWLEEETWEEVIDDTRSSLEHWESHALPEEWTTHGHEGRVDQSVFGTYNAWNGDTSFMYNNTDFINRWLCQNYGQAEDDLTHSNRYCYHDNVVFAPATEPRFSQSAADTRAASRKRKLEEVNDEMLESQSDKFLMIQQVTGPKRRRLYPNYDPGEDDVTQFYDYSFCDNNEEFVAEPRLSQSSGDIHSDSRKRKMDEVDDTLQDSRSDTFLISLEIPSTKRRRI